jgi:hypothetical protein
MYNKEGTGLAMGRVMLAPTFIISAMYWVLPLFMGDSAPKPPEMLNDTFNSLLIYEGYKKVRYTLHNYVTADKPKTAENVQ